MNKNKNSPAKIAATNRYRDKTYDTFSVSVQKGKKQELKNFASENGLSLQGLAKAAIEKFICDQTGKKIEL